MVPSILRGPHRLPDEIVRGKSVDRPPFTVSASTTAFVPSGSVTVIEPLTVRNSSVPDQLAEPAWAWIEPLTVDASTVPVPNADREIDLDVGFLHVVTVPTVTVAPLVVPSLIGIDGAHEDAVAVLEDFDPDLGWITPPALLDRRNRDRSAGGGSGVDPAVDSADLDRLAGRQGAAPREVLCLLRRGRSGGRQCDGDGRDQGKPA
jgi:hypothetical protein